MNKIISFKLSSGANVEVTPLDPVPLKGIGVRYDFVISHVNGAKESFIYTPESSANNELRTQPNEGSFSFSEQEALLIFQKNFQ